MAHSLFTTTIIDRRTGNDLTAIEIQRWEDGGGAALPDATPPRKPTLHRSADRGAGKFRPASAARFHCRAPTELAAAE